MIAPIRTPSQQLVTVFGGTGFLGRHVVQALVRRGYRIRVASRRPDRAFFLQPLGTVGQIYAVQANLRDPDSVARAVAGADHVVNLVGVLQESGRQTFDSLQAKGPRLIAESASPTANLVQVSAIGADLHSEAAYARSKAAGEVALFEVRPDAVVIRPSLMFGAGDGLFTRFASLARLLPVLPLVGADTRLQPVFVCDVADAIAKAVDGAVPGGRIYEAGGPQVSTLRDIVSYVLAVTERRAIVLSLPKALGRIQGSVLGFLDKITLGLIPDELVMTRDQAIMLETDNVVSEKAIAEGRTLQGLGIEPTAFEAIVPSYLVRFRRTGQFDLKRRSGSDQAPMESVVSTGR
jgi:uncharacterized protein YbjT (DUF2867 family)